MSIADDLILVSTNDDHVVTVRLLRPVITDLALTTRLQTHLLDTLAQADPCRGVVIDFKQVSVMSSQFIGTLLKVVRHCKKRGHGLALCRLNRNVRQPLAIMKLDRLMKVFDDLPSAVAFVSPK